MVLRTGSVIVFCRTRHGVDRLAKKLNNAGVGAANLHGGRAQNQRDRALAAFTSGRVPVLVATDVAARGIHVDQVACVVHFDPPADKADWVHRSGRTGRAGEDGIVVCFVGKQDEHPVRKILDQLKSDTAIEHPDVDALGEVRPVRVDAKRPPQDESAAKPAPRREASHHEAPREQQPKRKAADKAKAKAARRTEAVAAPSADGETPSREWHKYQQGKRPVTNSAGKPKPGKHKAAKARHRRRKRAVGA